MIANLEELTKNIKLKYKDDEWNRYYDCPACKNGEIKVADSVFYGRCDNCNMTLIDYKPLPHQEEFHKSTAQYKLSIAAFGTGKTTANCAELGIHALETPNGKALITANTLNQVRDAVIPELEKFLPPWFIETSRKSPSPYYKLKNGFEIVCYSSNDQENLRSLNLTAFYIEEASGISYDIFDQLMTRLRNKAGIIRDKDGFEVGYKYLGLVSSNPEEGWIKDKFLYVSDKIFGSPSVDTSVYKNIQQKKKEKHFHSFLAATRDNKYLPRGYIERTIAGKSEKWIRKYIDCYLDTKEGAVYPDIAKYFIEPFPIPDEWERVAGLDPGFNDPTAFPLGAIDPKTGIIYIYTGHYEAEQPISYHAKKIKSLVEGKNLLFPIQADPSVNKRNDRDGRSYKQYFYDLTGLVLEEANNDILYGIEKVRDYLYQGKLFFFNNIEELKHEALNYVYVKGDKNSNDKPIDKYNHYMDAIRYIVAKLPENPNDMETIYLKRDFNIYNGVRKRSPDISTVFSGDTVSERNVVTYGNGIYRRRI